MYKIARKLKKKNITEYLIYMWQVEDLIRANQFNIDKIKASLIDPMPSLSEEELKAELQWFTELIDMMYTEGVKESGHLQINQNVIIQLNDLHQELISCTKYPLYNAAFYKALPFIAELRAKNNEEKKCDIEMCFDALYGVILLRLQKKELTEQTKKAVDLIANFVAVLANYYAKDKAGELKLTD